MSYAAKSTFDPKGSIGTQMEDGRAVAAADGWDLVAEYPDENRTGYTGNRGPKLTRAMEHCERLVAEHGQCALIVQHSDRLARGNVVDARHLLEYAIWALKTGVTLISKQNPEVFGNLVYTALAGEQAHGESRRKSAAVRDGMKRRADKGLMSGTRTYGYRYLRDGTGVEIDPVEAEVVRRIFAEYLEGVTMSFIARGLHRDGIRTAKGGMWRQSTVSTILNNVTYTGKLKHHDRLLDGAHEAIIDQETWDRTQVLLAVRPARGRGRLPRGNHLFRGGLLRCECGWGLVPRTNGRGHQVYVCSGRHAQGRAYCDTPHLWRSSIDTAVYNYFEQVALDIEATRRVVVEASERKLAEIRSLLVEAEREAQRADERLARVKRDYLNGDLTAAEWRELRVDLAAEGEAARAQAAQLRASEAEVAASVATVEAESEAVRQLAEIRAAITEDVRQAEGVEAVRAALARLFEAFIVHRSAPERAHVELIGDFWIEPVVRGDFLGEPGPSGMPRPRREQLDMPGATNNTGAGAGARSARCAPTAEGAGARTTASAPPRAASRSARSCPSRAGTPTRPGARAPCTSR